jgi:hypothetical protein
LFDDAQASHPAKHRSTASNECSQTFIHTLIFALPASPTTTHDKT